MSLRKVIVASLITIAALPWVPMRAPVSAQSQDPCAVASTYRAARVRDARDRDRKYGHFGADSRDVRDLLHHSSAAAQARARTASIDRVTPAADRDDQHIAILEDSAGELITRPNRFDLVNSGVRFEPGNGGYTINTIGGEFRSALGRAVTLNDDDSVAEAIAFPFRFYDREFTSLFINSDGNLTFEEADHASSARSVQRVAGGVPRIAPFFADLDPSVGGKVFVNAAPDAMTITWCAVPGFGLEEIVTAQTVLLPGGAIEFRYGATDLEEGIVALSPGRVADVTAVDFNRVATQPAGAVAVTERFAAVADLDLVAASRRFYANHPAEFDQLVFFTDTPVVHDAFAFETTIQNSIQGIGAEAYDYSAEFGSAGALHSVINMDRISKYPSAPDQKLFSEISTWGVLAHETGHRWLARMLFSDVNRAVSDQLLGRQRAHWSFFMDTDGSVMEGNEIEDLGGGRFRTAAGAEKYNRLDLYAMGLVTPAEVPAWFYVDVPVSFHEREDPAIAGVTFTGTRRNVTIQNVIEVMGPRVPDAGSAPRLHRQAFVFVRRASAVLDPQDLALLRRIREGFPNFFRRLTENRMTLRATLP